MYKQLVVELDDSRPPGGAPLPRTRDCPGGYGASAVGPCRVGHAERGGGRDGSVARDPAEGLARGGARLARPAHRMCGRDGRHRGSGRAVGRPVRDHACDARRGVDRAGGTSLLRHRHPGRPAARPRVPPGAGRHRPGDHCRHGPVRRPDGRGAGPPQHLARRQCARGARHARRRRRHRRPDRPGRRHDPGRPDPRRPAVGLHRHRSVGHHGPGAGARRREAGHPPVGRRGRHLPARGAGRSPRDPGPGRHRRSR